jgi:hypothetical protein
MDGDDEEVVTTTKFSTSHAEFSSPSFSLWLILIFLLACRQNVKSS